MGVDLPDPQEVPPSRCRSDNEVKNRYHSRMRKGVRKINKLMADTLRPHHRPLNVNIISKIIQTAEDVYVPAQGPSSKQAKEAYCN